MRSITVVVILISVALLANGRRSTNYKISSQEWSDYKSAVSSAGLKETTLGGKTTKVPSPEVLFHLPKFSVEYSFAGKCAESYRNSITYSTTDNELSNNDCKLLGWLNSTCTARATVLCNKFSDFTRFVQISTPLPTYGKNVSHWWLVHHGRRGGRSASAYNRDAPKPKRESVVKSSVVKSSNSTKREDPVPWVWPGGPFDEDAGYISAEECYQWNIDGNWNFEQETRPRWHVQFLAQNNGRVPTSNPFAKNSAYAGSSNGRIYIADSGIDAYHPEFVYSGGGQVLSRVEDLVSHHFNGATAAEEWIGAQDEAGHGTMVAAFAAGKTLGVYPNARIINVKFYVDNLYDCWFSEDPKPKLDGDGNWLWENGALVPDLGTTLGWGFPEMVPEKPEGYPFHSECGSQDPSVQYSVQEFINGAEMAYAEAKGYRTNSGVPSIFMTAAAPRIDFNPLLQTFWEEGEDGIWEPVTPDCTMPEDLVPWTQDYDDCMAGSCMSGVSTVLQNMITDGIIVVIAAGNEGVNMDSAANLLAAMIYQPYIFDVPDIVVVGGMDREYTQSPYATAGFDDTCFNMFINTVTGSSNYGAFVDYYAPITGFTMFAQTHRVRHRQGLTFNPAHPVPSQITAPAYFMTNLASGTSFATPQVAAGLLMHLSNFDTNTIKSNPSLIVSQTLQAAKEWAAPHVQQTFWADTVCPYDNVDDFVAAEEAGERPEDRFWLYWGDYVDEPNPQVMYSFRMIPSANANQCVF